LRKNGRNSENIIHKFYCRASVIVKAGVLLPATCTKVREEMPIYPGMRRSRGGKMHGPAGWAVLMRASRAHRLPREVPAPQRDPQAEANEEESGKDVY
jgi:hypothetical protein